MIKPNKIALPIITLLAVALAACEAPSAEQPPAADPTQAQASLAEANTESNKGTDDMSALESLLATYASSNAPAWNEFDSVQGVTWTDPAKVANPDAKPDNAFSRSGKLTLSGFQDTDLPNGKTGPEADYVRGNEGESGITLNGTEERVTSIAVKKFYPDTDYRKTLAAQIGPEGAVRAISRSCRLAEGTTTGEADFSRNEFFELSLADGRVLFAEGSVDEEGGKYTPGSTTYFFYKEEPTQRIDSMQCTRI